MAKKQSYEDIFKEVQALEDEISVLTGKINESVRNLVQFETEANNLLVNWRELAIQGQKAPNCLKEIENINAKDIDEQKKYDRFRKEKDDKQQELRKKVLTLLKTPQPAHHPDERKKKMLLIFKKVLLFPEHRSQVLTKLIFPVYLNISLMMKRRSLLKLQDGRQKRQKGKKGRKKRRKPNTTLARN